jgi:hypothetical protein
MGAEVTEGMEWLLWLIEKTAWLLEPQGYLIVIAICLACYFGLRIRRPRR